MQLAVHVLSHSLSQHADQSHRRRCRPSVVTDQLDVVAAQASRLRWTDGVDGVEWPRPGVVPDELVVVRREDGAGWAVDGQWWAAHGQFTDQSSATLCRLPHRLSTAHLSVQQRTVDGVDTDRL